MKSYTDTLGGLPGVSVLRTITPSTLKPFAAGTA